MKNSKMKFLLMGCLFIPGLAVADEYEPFMAEDSEIGVTEAFVERSVGGSSPYFPVRCRLDGTRKPVFNTIPSTTNWGIRFDTSPILSNLGQFVDVNADGFVDFVTSWYNGAAASPNYYRATFINYGGNGWIMDACETNNDATALGMLFVPCSLLTPNPSDPPNPC